MSDFWNPMDCCLPDSSVHGILQVGILDWVAIPSSRGSFWPRDWNQVSCIAGKIFIIWATRDSFYPWCQSLSCCVQLFATTWTEVCQTSLSFTISLSLPKLMSIQSVMLSNHLILCHPLLLMPSIFPSFRVFSNEWALHQVAKVLEFQLQHQCFQWIFRTDFL